MKKVIITGAGGYIGSVSTYLFLQQGYQVVALDNFSTGYQKPLDVLVDKFGKDKLTLQKLHLQDDLTSFFSAHTDAQAVIHYAASCSVNESMENPAKYFENNVGGSLHLIEAMTQAGIKNIVFSSTCATYGNAQYVPVDENHPQTPENPYGESKLMVEKIIQWYARLKDLHYIILRYFNVCGASDDGLIGDSKKPSSLLVQNAVRGALEIAPFELTCPEVDTPDKTPIRDYIHVVDLNQAHIKAVEYLLGGGKSDIINLGTGAGSSVLEILEMVKKVTGKEFPIGKAVPRKGESAKIIASTQKAQDILGWKPTHTMEDSIQSLVTWYQSHPQGWE